MGGLFLLGAVLVALFVLGFVILELMHDLRSFFDYFALRHRVIQRVRQADPVVYVPEGSDAVERILSLLASTNSDVRGIMATPGAVAIPALLTGRSGLTYSFNAYLRRPASTLWRILTLGSPGFAVFVKAFEKAPTLADLRALRSAVEDSSIAAGIPPARILVLWRVLPRARDRARRWDLRFHPCRRGALGAGREVSYAGVSLLTGAEFGWTREIATVSKADP